MEKITPAAKELGKLGDEKARKLLQAFGFTLSRPDWAGYLLQRRLFHGEWIEAGEDIEFEVKAKTQQAGGGHGADIKQIKKRMRRFKKYGFRQFLLIVEANGNVYGQWLHQLERGPQKDHKGIRIYPIRCFNAIPTWPNIFV